MQIYHYHPDTKDYLGDTQADLDPLETEKAGEPRYLIPAFATTETPPGASVEQRVRYLQNEWVVEDIPPVVEEPVIEKTFEELKDLKVLEINMHYDITMSALPLDPPKERETYSAQYMEAVQWQLNNTFPTPMIDALLTERQVVGEDKSMLVDNIIVAATAFGTVGGMITGKRQRLIKAVDAAETVEELSVILWDAS